MKNFFTLILITFVQTISFSQLLTWSFSGQPGSQVSQNSSSSGTGIGTGVLSRGSGISANAGANSMNSADWLESTNDIDNVAEQESENDYYEFTLPIQAGYTATISTVVIGTAASGSGPNGATLRWSEDSYASNLGTGSASSLTATINQTKGPNVTITFRLYGTRSNTGGGTTGTYRINSLAINGTSALPVELVYFNASLENKRSNLVWATATEYNNDFFSIERSTNGIDFRAIGKVNGAGNSVSTLLYSFVDETPAAGVNYYRLKQVDFDGKFEYSKVISVTTGKTANINLSPVPAQNQLHVNLETALAYDGTWELLDITGRLIHAGTIPAETFDFNVDVTTLTPGAYFLRMVDGQTVVTKQFQK